MNTITIDLDRLTADELATLYIALPAGIGMTETFRAITARMYELIGEEETNTLIGVTMGLVEGKVAR